MHYLLNGLFNSHINGIKFLTHVPIDSTQLHVIISHQRHLASSDSACRGGKKSLRLLRLDHLAAYKISYAMLGNARGESKKTADKSTVNIGGTLTHS